MVRKGALEFEELAKLILAVAVLVFVVLLIYLLRDKIAEAMGLLKI